MLFVRTVLLAWLRHALTSTSAVMLVVVLTSGFISLTNSVSWPAVLDQALFLGSFGGAFGTLSYRSSLSIDEKSRATVIAYILSTIWGAVFVFSSLRYNVIYNLAPAMPQSIIEHTFISICFGFSASLLCFIPLELLKKLTNQSGEP